MSEPLLIETGRRRPAIAIGVLLVFTVAYLRFQGRVWWCACGQPWPLALHVNSMHNSQHLFDAYSLSHVLHGVLFFGLFWFTRRRIPFAWRLALATLIEAVWEMAENSPLIINRYREGTVSLGYTGDSIANSLGDIASFAAGFYLARLMGLWKSVAFFIAVELIMLFWMRDNLTLNVLMLLWPIKAIRDWQAAG